MDTVKLSYPDWQQSLLEAVLEFDREKLPAKALKAEGLILKRLQELQQSNNGHSERMAISDGLSILRSIKRDRLDPS